MRQLRIASGDDTTSTVTVLNQVIAALYPDATATTPGTDSRSLPHLVTESYVHKLEKGHHARLDLYGTRWFDVSQFRDRTPLNTSRVPEWLVRAYDVAFCANGYLVDMFVWSAALLADQLRDVPRRVRDLPAHMPPGGEYEFLAEHFPAPDRRTRTLLTTQTQLAITRRDQAPHPDLPWRPMPGDESTSHDDTPEGQLVPPDGRFIAVWNLHNTGSVPWRDRVLYRVGAYPDGVRTPPFVVIPDTDAGATVRIECPMRAPIAAGTYRACLKMGWPNGTYCFPNTLLGLFVTLTVAPGDLNAPDREWRDHAE